MAYLIQKTEMKRRSHRRAKLALLRKRFAAASSDDEKSAVLAKVGKVAPWLSQEDFLDAIKASK